MQVWAFCISRRPVRIGQKEHGIPPGDLAAPGGEEDLRAAAFGIACDVGHVRASELVQMREEAPKDGIFSCDVGGQVIAAVDAVADAFGEQRPVGRKHLSPVVTTGRMAVQRGENGRTVSAARRSSSSAA